MSPVKSLVAVAVRVGLVGLAGLVGLVVPSLFTNVHAAESDVRFGLTKWLALQAGFVDREAEAIAVGNQRVDSGDLQFMAEGLLYACLTPDDDGWQRARERHYPSSAAAPTAPAQRLVVAGGEEAFRRVNYILQQPASQSGFLLGKLGEALSTLQESWSNQGVPDVARFATDALSCDANRYWGHSVERGGWNSHRADQTYRWPADSLAMARATYDVLNRYPDVMQVKRAPKAWSEITPAVEGFIAAATKTQKSAWFVEHGFQDVSFLQGISLPDGKEPFTAVWQGRRLPPLSSPKSEQYGAQPDVLDFFSRFMADWMMASRVESVLDVYGLPAKVGGAKGLQPPRPGAPAQLTQRTQRTQLQARLKLWRLRDHASVADLAHAKTPLDRKDLARVDQLMRGPNAVASYTKADDAYIPIVPAGIESSLVLPFVTAPAKASAAGNPRAVAVVRLRHAPYDTVAVVAEKLDGQWRVVDLVSAVDH